MSNLLTANYWFNLQPETLIPIAQKLFLASIIILAVLAVLTALIKNKAGIYHGFLNRLHLFFWVNSLIGLLFFFFNYEMIFFLSARFWLGLWLLGMLIWLILILKKLKIIPIQKKQIEAEKEFKKYLP